MKAFVSKYGLTKGIFEIEGKLYKSDVANAGAVYFKEKGSSARRLFLSEGEWHKTYEEAEARVQEMARKKIRSLAHQIEKLEKIAAGKHGRKKP